MQLKFIRHGTEHCRWEHDPHTAGFQDFESIWQEAETMWQQHGRHMFGSAQQQAWGHHQHHDQQQRRQQRQHFRQPHSGSLCASISGWRHMTCLMKSHAIIILAVLWMPTDAAVARHMGVLGIAADQLSAGSLKAAFHACARTW